jgi:acyl carrier protein
MSNEDKYAQVFMDTFSVDREQLNDKFVYQCVPAWDSVGHMGLIAALEDTFGIMMETDDIIDFSGYEKGKQTLAKYGVEF